MKDAPCESLWDVRDVMAYLKASRSWVYLKAEAGILPSLRIGGLLRFDPEAIRAFARGEVQPGASVLPLRRKGAPS
jgi:predicted DNA-binding transcriptional regulator AlpA